MKKVLIIIYVLIFVAFLFTLNGCNDYFSQPKIQSVGMLVENSIHDQTWGNKGYQGLLSIKDEFNVDVYFMEEVQTQQDVRKALQEFSNKGVNLVFGHSSIYGEIFDRLSESYPNIHFVYFNGGYFNDNITSLNFSAHAMGFFGGMVAGEMTDTNHVGIIAAYGWQPEIEGFFEGVNYQNPEAKVHIEYVNSWDDKERAIQLLERINNSGTDIVYPAGDSFSVAVIEEMKNRDKNVIGYVSDQIDLGENTVLTSTVQHVDKLYLLAAKMFNREELNSGVMTFDFDDDVISLGEFSPKVPKAFQKYIKEEVEEYKETGLLPNER